MIISTTNNPVQYGDVIKQSLTCRVVAAGLQLTMFPQVINQRSEIPKDKPVLIYCNTDSLAAQAGFALRILGYDNVLIFQDGFEGWEHTYAVR